MQYGRRVLSWRVLLRSLIALTVGVFVWYGVGRALSPWRAVRVVDSGGGTTSLRLDSQPMRVVAYNIAHGRGAGGSNWTDRDARRARLKEIASLLRELDADVVVLNEVDFSSIWSGHENQAALIAKEAGYRYRVELSNIDVSIPFVSLRFGNVLLSRTPIVDAKLIELPGYAKWETVLGGKKQAMACTVEMPDGHRVMVVAAHLDHRGDESNRIASAGAIMDAVSRSAFPIIIAGDMNSTLPGLPGARHDLVGATAVSIFADQGYTAPLAMENRFEPVVHATFPSSHPKRTIDWVLINPPLQFDRVEVIPADLSDHLPVFAEISRRDKTQNAGMQD